MGNTLLDTVVVRSQFLVVLPLHTGSSLAVHALLQTRLVIKPDVVAVLDAFSSPRRVGEVVDAYRAAQGSEPGSLLAAISSLLSQGLLVAGPPEAERDKFAAMLSQWYGRDPEAARRASLRLSAKQAPRFAAPVARGLDNLSSEGRRLDVVMVGLCDVQIEMDVLRAEARALGIDLHAQATFESTVDILQDTPHDAVIVGALGARHGHWHRGDGGGDLWPERYARAMRELLLRIRALTGAPVLIHTLAVPTCSARGLTDRGPDSFVERCRQINRDLVDVAAEYPDTYLVDVDAALALEGKRRLLDDRVMTGTHLGGLGWWTMLPAMELRTVHGLRPPTERLAELGVTDPFEFDRVVAAEQAAVLAAVFGIGRRDTVVVDVDGVLWPGEVVATGSPLPPDVDFGTWSYHGFFLGVGEALQGLRARGLRLAGLTRGEETAVRAAWTYGDRAPRDRVLLPEDFAALRFGVADPPAALREIGRLLDAGPSQMVFVSVDATRRAAVQTELPDVWTIGDNPFAIRGTLLTHPALQVVAAVQEGVEHPTIMVALARRERARKLAPDPERFTATLGLRCAVTRGVGEGDVDRVCELVTRTRQFTTTGRIFSRTDLLSMRGDPTRRLFTMRVTDQFADYGLVGVAVAVDATIELLLLSCRVVGLGVDRVLLRTVLDDLCVDHPVVRARLLTLGQNAPARGLFRANGFHEAGVGLWEITRGEVAAVEPWPPTIDVVQSNP